MIVHLLMSSFIIISFILFNFIKLNEKGMRTYVWFSFYLIFLFLALRYDYGNDYLSYKSIFYDLNLYDDLSNYNLEIGWVFLNKIFGFLNFYILVAFTSFIYVFILSKLLKENVDPKYYWFSFFLILIVPNNFLINLSAMRQSIAIIFFICYVLLFCNKKYFISFLSIIFGFLFHNTIIFAFFISLFVFLLRKINNINFISIFLIISLFIFFKSNFLYSLLFPILNTINDKYSYYGNDGENALSFGLGFLYQIFLFVLINLLSRNISDLSNLFLVRLSSLCFILVPFALIDANLVRLNFYFEFLLIISLPILMKYIKGFNERLIFVFAICFWYIFNYIEFFKTLVYFDKYFTYKTLFMIW